MWCGSLQDYVSHFNQNYLSSTQALASHDGLYFFVDFIQNGHHYLLAYLFIKNPLIKKAIISLSVG